MKTSLEKLTFTLVISTILFAGNALSQQAATNAPPPLPALSEPADNNKLSDLKLPGEASAPASVPALATPAFSAPTNQADTTKKTRSSPNLATNTAGLEVPELPDLSGKPSIKKKADKVNTKDKVENTDKEEASDKEESDEDTKSKKHKKSANLNPKLAFIIKDRLPEQVYKKYYDPYNRHLPTAYYEQEYDKLLFLTAAHNDVDGLRAMLDSGRSPNLKDANGDTVLLVAVKSNSVNAVKLLLNRNADARIKDRNGFTAQAIVNSIGNDAMVRVFAGLD